MFQRPVFQRLAALAILICLPAAVMAQQDGMAVTKADMVRFLNQIPQVAPIEEDMRRLGFAGENLALAVRQTEAFYTDPKISDYIAGRVLAFYGGEAPRDVADGLVWPLIARGLTHLPTRELVHYYNIERAMMKALPMRQCGQAMRRQIAPQRLSDAMSRVAARLHTPSLREYYRIELKAARLGTSRNAVRLGAADTERVEARIRGELDMRIAASRHPARLRAAMKNMDKSRNAPACEVGLMFYDAVLAIKGRELRNALIYMGLP